jgi:hypothetical protein
MCTVPFGASALHLGAMLLYLVWRSPFSGESIHLYLYPPPPYTFTSRLCPWHCSAAVHGLLPQLLRECTSSCKNTICE